MGAGTFGGAAWGVEAFPWPCEGEGRCRCLPGGKASRRAFRGGCEEHAGEAGDGPCGARCPLHLWQKEDDNTMKFTQGSRREGKGNDRGPKGKARGGKG